VNNEISRRRTAMKEIGNKELQRKFEQLERALENEKVMTANSLIEELMQEVELEDVESVEARLLYELMEEYDMMMERLYEEDEIMNADLFDHDEGEWY
jgi:hypothetical protein